MDSLTLISSIVALIGAATGIYIARSTRHKNEGDAALAITQAAENIVNIRDKDAKAKQEQIDTLISKVTNLENYVDYLHDWIGIHVDGDAEPMTLREYLDEKKNPSS